MDEVAILAWWAPGPGILARWPPGERNGGIPAVAAGTPATNWDIRSPHERFSQTDRSGEAATVQLWGERGLETLVQARGRRRTRPSGRSEPSAQAV